MMISGGGAKENGGIETKKGPPATSYNKIRSALSNLKVDFCQSSIQVDYTPMGADEQVVAELNNPEGKKPMLVDASSGGCMLYCLSLTLLCLN